MLSENPLEGNGELPHNVRSFDEINAEARALGDDDLSSFPGKQETPAANGEAQPEENEEETFAVEQQDPTPQEEMREEGPEEAAPKSPPIHLTDRGNALRMVKEFGDDLRHCFPWKKWLSWDGKRWLTDNSGAATRHAKKTLVNIFAETVDKMKLVHRAMKDESKGPEAKAKLQVRLKQLQSIQSHCLKSEAAPRINAMCDLARSEEKIPILPEDMDKDPWLLNCVNGTLDLRTGQLREHRREDGITKLCPVPYDPNATCEVFERFVDHIFQSNSELILFVRRLFGYALTGDVREQVLPIFYGSGSNGKSTLLKAILEMLGDEYGIAAARDLLLAKQGERHPTEVADLFGKRLAVTIETDEGRRLAESLIKDLTGGDIISARRMREDFWRFAPTHKLIMATNHKPTVRGTDHAIWRRLRLIPFEVVVPDNEQDKLLPDKLKSEYPGILAWCVKGCMEWQKDGLGMPEKVKVATSAYRGEQDVVGAFIAECCVTGLDDYRVRAGDLYAAFVAWCKRTGEKEISQKVFGPAIEDKGFGWKVSNGKWYLKITLRPSDDGSSEEGNRQYD